MKRKFLFIGLGAIAAVLLLIIAMAILTKPKHNYVPPSHTIKQASQKVAPKTTTSKQSQPELSEAPKLSSIEPPKVAKFETPTINNTTKQISNVLVNAQTQYSHTENGHSEGQFYAIKSSPINITGDQTKIITGSVSRENSIGTEKGSIVIDYNLTFNGNVFVSGSVNTTSYSGGMVRNPGYVSSQITLTPGQTVTNPIQFIETSTGTAGSGSHIYPITATISLT